MRIGIDLGGSHIGVGLIYKDKIMAMKEKDFVEEDKKNIRQVIVNNSVSMIKDILKKEMISLKDIDLIGISSPGLISKKAIVKASNLSIEDFIIVDELEEKLKIKVAIHNDAKCAGLAEFKYGALKGYKDCLFICLGTGIGGAAFMNGKLMEPNKFAGFEFGHMVIEKDGRLCSCGKKGCFETYGSMNALKKRVTVILGKKASMNGKDFREELLNSDNPLIQLEIESWLNSLKIGIGNLIDIFEPEAICFGGSFAYYEDTPIWDRLMEKLHEKDLTFTSSKKPEYVTAKFKNNAGIIGATII